MPTGTRRLPYAFSTASRPRYRSSTPVAAQSKPRPPNRATALGLIDWLSSALGRNGSQPESLYLIGSRSELDAIAGPLDDCLSIPVVATHDAQLGLARGAASSDLKHVDNTATEVRSGFASHARTLTVMAAVAVASLLTLSSADSPIRLVERASQQAPPTADAVEAPASAAPLAPLVFPPPPAAAALPTPEEPVPVRDSACRTAGTALSRSAAGSTHAGGATGPSRPSTGRTGPRRFATRGSDTAPVRNGPAVSGGSAGRGAEPALRRLAVS